MRLLAFTGILLSLALGLSLAGPPAATETVKLNGHTFTLPAGFTIELAVELGLIDRPITVDLDEQGRLYVADSSGSNAKVELQLKERPHRIVRLEDSDGDGVYDRSTVFADKMMFPEGTLWHDGSLYVAAPPSIWKLTDKDGDGVADERVEWFQGKTLTGCANDLHGPYLGLDGRIYWAKGAFAKQTYKRSDKSEWITRAAHLFRSKVDGTSIEPVMTGGMDNPVDVVFTPTGERLFTTTFFQHPAGGRRDGLVHAVYGGVYGKDHSPVYEHPWTAPSLMPVLTHMGPAAPAGLTRYESSVFGPDYRDNLFAAQFNLQKVSRHVLTPSGATFTTADSDFVVSDNRDFHPTDVMEDADGSLLVIDTGGWYKLCCPSSQLVKADVHGAIYRVRRKDAPKVADPRGLKLDWANVSAKYLNDPRPAVVRRAMHLLGKKGVEALPELEAAPRRNAVWTATRIDAPEARAFVRKALDDEDDAVRQAALHSVSLWRDKVSSAKTITLLRHKSAHVRRAAAEANGRIGDPTAVPALLDALREPADRMLEHSLIYALIEIADPEATAKGLADDNPRVRRAALIALDQMRGGKLEATQVAKALTATDTSLKEAAWWIAGRHPDWGGTLATFFRDRMGEANPPDDLVAQLSRFAKNAAIQELLSDRLRDGTRQEKLLALRAMAGSALKPTPDAWVAGLAAALNGDADLLRAALTTARALPLRREKALVERLLSLAGSDKLPADLRLAALAAVPGGLTEVVPDTFRLLVGKIDREQPVVERALAVEALTKARLSVEQQLALGDAVKTAGPMELDRLLDVFAKTTDPKVGLHLLRALKSAPSRSSLRVDGLKTRLAKYNAVVQKELAVLCAELDADLLEQREQLDKMVESMKDGDVRRGQLVFNSQKAACISCHAIGYVGGKIGPDLTRIGSIRSERDLLESILFPNASLVRSYEPVQVTTVAGKSYNGVVKKDTPEELVLTISAIEEVRVLRSQVEEMQPSKVSIMPGGLEKILSTREMADLVAFLKACK